MIKNIVFENIGFADSEFSSVTLSERTGDLRIALISWDEKEIIITLENPIQLTYKLGSVVSNFFQIQDETPFLIEALSREYEKIPSSHPFKLYQLLDINDFPLIEVVAESVKVEKGTEIVGFDQ